MKHVTLYAHMCDLMLFFFFKQKTAYEMRISDWSSDVCSSDLLFTKRELKFANAELLNSYPDPWERLTGQKILPGQSRSRDEQAFLTENANRLIVGSAINSKKYAG